MYGFQYIGKLDKTRLAQLTFLAALIILLYRFINHALISQLVSPALVYPDLDRTYWFYIWTGIPELLVSNRLLGVLFDGLLLVSCALSIILFRLRWLPICFSILSTIYFITFNVYAGHHYHGMIGLVLIGIPFWFKDNQSFHFAWEGLRYYFLFIFSSAAIWKIMRGSVFHVEQMTNILKAQHVDFLVQQADTVQTGLITNLIQNSTLSHWILLGAVALQLSFLIGFFTKRWDHLLFLLSLLFHLGNFMVMRIVSVELLILNLALLPRTNNY